MLSALAALTIRGSLVFAAVWLLERIFASRMRPRSRRAWWWLAGFAFVVPLEMPLLPTAPASLGVLHPDVSRFVFSDTPPSAAAAPARETSTATRALAALPWLWAIGAVASMGVVGVRTWRTTRRWARERLCTDPALLGLLEDCKAVAGVTAPIGLVVSDRIAAPALLGWMRPRILLPATLVGRSPPAHTRAVLLHELAHFRAFDLALHWVFCLAGAVHWFNPFAHLAARRWLHYRELAADEAALAWLSPAERHGYGDALIETLEHANTFPTPHGALALGESLENLKHRIVMITRHASLARHGLFALVVSCVLSGLLCVQALRAADAAPTDPKTAAVAAMRPWLEDVDTARYAKSWETASALFKSKVTSKVWEQQLTQVRTPLGACEKREPVGASLQETIPSGDGGGLKGPFVIAQFDSSFANLTAARETVTFMREADGTWRAAGYFIAPR